MSTVLSQPCARFFDLPIELRYLIYEEIVVVGKIFYAPTQYEEERELRLRGCKLYKTPQLQLFRVCKRIHQEAEKLYLEKNLFVLPLSFDLHPPFSSLPRGLAGRGLHDRWLFSRAFTKHVRNLSIAFGPREDIIPRTVLTDPTVNYYCKFRGDLFRQLESAWFLSTKHLLRLDWRFACLEIDFSSARCPRGCCTPSNYLEFGYWMKDRVDSKEFRILGMEEESLAGQRPEVMWFMEDVIGMRYRGDERTEEDKRAETDLLTMWNIKLNPKVDPWTKWRIEESKEDNS